MYQVQREKLDQKYRSKDETIRKLNTQLQMNKFAVKELSECFNQYLNNNQNIDINQSNYISICLIIFQSN